jgi:hypothetical protein
MTTEGERTPKRGKKVESTFADKWDPSEAGELLEGRYLGYEEAKGNRGEAFTVYHLQIPDGKRVSVAGAHLDSIMHQIPKGTYVWITFKGKQRLPNGNTMHLFDVEPEEGTRLLDPMKQGATTR